jgi:protein CpxP
MKMMTFRRYVMRAGVLAICSAALCTVPMVAQGGGARMTPEMRVDAIDKAVTLTPDQKTKIMEIYTADQQKVSDLRAAQDPDLRAKVTAMRADENAQVKALLTPDQNTKYDAYVASLPAPGGGGGPQ